MRNIFYQNEILMYNFYIYILANCTTPYIKWRDFLVESAVFILQNTGRFCVDSSWINYLLLKIMIICTLLYVLLYYQNEFRWKWQPGWIKWKTKIIQIKTIPKDIICHANTDWGNRWKIWGRSHKSYRQRLHWTT